MQAQNATDNAFITQCGFS